MNFRGFTGLLLGAAICSSAAAADVRVGVVDMQRVLESSKQGQAAQKKLESDLKTAQADIDSKKGDLEKRQAAFSKQKTSLNPDALRSKQEELISLEKDLKRSFQDQQDSLRRKNASLVGDLAKKIRKIVDEYGKEKNFTVILERGAQSVLFSDNDIDITEDIISRFDE
jgi:outer membrane protein